MTHRAPGLAATVAAALLLVPSRTRVSASPADLADILRPIRERFDVPALAGAVVSGDTLIALGADGVRRRGSPQRVETGDRFHLGSCTKAMTATLIAMLVAEKRLAWDERVGPYFDDIPKVDAGWKDATLVQLLSHQAGAPESLDADGLWGRLWRHTGTPREARRVLVGGVLGRPPAHPPGSKMLYSNAGYAIAGAMAEKVADRPWEELLRERLFAPLGMKDAGFGAPGTKGAVDAPCGHREDGTPVEPGPGADNPVAIGPAGTVHATLSDWAKFASLHLRREDKRLGLSRDSFPGLHSPPRTSGYVLGWLVADRPLGLDRPWGGRVLTHAGSNTMWYAAIWVAPQSGLAVLVTCNQGGDKAAKACEAAATDLVRWYDANR